MDFDNDGAWFDYGQEGPVVHAPTIIKNISVAVCRIEWLNMSDPKDNFYAKNHMCMTLVFNHYVTIDGMPYGSARLSIEEYKDPSREVAAIVSPVRNITPSFLHQLIL